MIKHNSFDDIIPPEKRKKRSIRDVPISRKKKNKIDELLKETEEMREEHKEHHDHEWEVHRPLQNAVKKLNKIQSSKNSFWIYSIILLVCIAGGLLYTYRGAEVTISLKTETVPVDIITSATPESLNATNTLSYKVFPIQKEGTKELEVTGEVSKVEKRATGTIIIYNNFSTAPQKLIATTRFETSGGLVYRLDKGVTVPGISTVGGKSVPGSVEGVVTADTPGSEYNIEKGDFVLPGFKGTPKYEDFYARSKTAMTGGFSGNLPKIDDSDLETANEELKTSLLGQAQAELQGEMPEGYVVFSNGMRTTYTSDIIPSTDGKVSLKAKVIVESLLFKKSQVESLIADSRNSQKYSFDNLGSLELTVQNIGSISSFISNPILSLRIAGNLSTGQSFDDTSLRNALAGKSKKQLQQILGSYPEIISAEAVIKPLLSRSFPKNPDLIKIIVTKAQ